MYAHIPGVYIYIYEITLWIHNQMSKDTITCFCLYGSMTSCWPVPATVWIEEDSACSCLCDISI